MEKWMMKSIALLLFTVLVISSKAQLVEKLVVHFAFNKSDLQPDALNQLDSLLQSNKNRFIFTGIDIDAHCDSVGNNTYNDSLSIQRALSVKKYLIDAGLSANVFTKVYGHGKREPLNENSTAQERLLNRRVELLINKIAVGIPDTSAAHRNISEVINDSSTKIGSTIVLKNLNFEGGRHILMQRSLPVLNELLKAMQENPNLKIEIQGHVCCTATYMDGMDNDLGTYDLSWQRARVIYEYLLGKHISAERMSFKGFGASRKLYPYERDEQEREENRRVEIKIISK
jgi:outer membrane protein OmpA-like peptidoglycan-associated protein